MSSRADFAVDVFVPCYYRGLMSNLDELLPKVQDIITRTNEFQLNDASDPKAFSKAVVGDLEVLAHAVAELIMRRDA